MRHLRTLFELAAALLGALLLVMAGPAFANEISNIAGAQWRSGGIAMSTQSNAVVLEVVEAGTTIELFRSDDAGSARFSVPTTLCGGVPVVLPSFSTGLPGESTFSAAASLRAGENAFLRIAAPRANLDPTHVDRIEIVATASSGDSERLTLSETDANSGVFVGAIATVAAPPAATSGDCRLSVTSGNTVEFRYPRPDGVSIVAASLTINAEYTGFVFDSQTGAPVSGARVSLVAIGPTNQGLANANAPQPSLAIQTVISGATLTGTGTGTSLLSPGEYRFPAAPTGKYHIVVEPPAPYAAPSQATPAQLAQLRGPTGQPYRINDASFGRDFVLNGPSGFAVDIPLDRPDVQVSLKKSASRAVAEPGDAAIFTITVRNNDTLGPKRGVILTDTPSQWLRLRTKTVQLDGVSRPDLVTSAADGSSFSIALPEIAAGATHVVRYAMVFRADTPAGEVANRVIATDPRGTVVSAGTSVRVIRETLASRMTLTGRITEGDCTAKGDTERGIPGVRVMLEDGSFAVTDGDGRYHFEGLRPGLHVVQPQPQTLPAEGRFVDCDRSAASAGSASSRFVRGQGGSLVVADFRAKLPAGWQPASRPAAPSTHDDAIAAGAETDWLALGDGPAGFLFPDAGHNPRAPAVRIAIRHKPSQTVELTANGEALEAVAFEGVSKSSDNRFAVSLWRGVPLREEETLFHAVVRNKDGSVAGEFDRQVDFASAPAQVELVPERSRLVADGATRPVVAVRLTDRKGRPVRAGLSGNVQINAPYESARALEQLQSRQLAAGAASINPSWLTEGSDGVALIELAPTMVSGPLRLEFVFSDGTLSRTRELESWIVPGDQKWTLVGLAEGSVGARNVAESMEAAGRFDSDLGDHARTAFYAKGRVLGKVLLTAAYDSAKQRSDERLSGAIDPQAYYTIFADGSARRFDAASREKLYVRVETPTAYAIYGDFETGFTQTNLGRYERAATGVKAEGLVGKTHLQGFAARISSRFHRDEIQGNGLSGPYRLSSRALIANSETVRLEVRDRFRSELIVSQQRLERFVDYDIDVLSGTITFSRPVQSRDAALNPQFIVITYEADELSQGDGKINAGARLQSASPDGLVRYGATAISDSGEKGRTTVLAADMRVKIDAATELRTEAGVSQRGGKDQKAWQIEALHRAANVDLAAYARRIDQDYGTEQQNIAERGRIKFGVDGRVLLGDHLSLTGSAWRDDSLADTARRDAVRIQGGWNGETTNFRLGASHFSDRRADGDRASSTVLEGAVTKYLLDRRLELSAASSVALANTGSIDLPTQHRFGAAYRLSQTVRMIGAYEIAEGDAIAARTLRGGFEVAPWGGSRITSTLGQQTISENGKRSFAALGLAQSFAVTSSLSLDMTVDGNRRLSGGDPAAVINPDHPVASGGHLGQDGELFEDFTAASLGASWRKDAWAATMRAEGRDGENANRRGLTAGVIRQLGDGTVAGSGFTWTRANAVNGATSEVFDGSLSGAYRPAASAFSALAKLSFRSDSVSGAVAGEAGAAGRTALTVNGEGKSRRLIGSISTNWSPYGYEGDDEMGAQKAELGVFVAGRYNFDRVESLSLSGFTLLGGIDGRARLNDRFEIGARATVRSAVTDRATSFSFGPELGYVPAKNMTLAIGYNVKGFRDEDFSAARQTDKGAYATIRMKFDADSFGFLGLGR